jgi:hypothetical protein
MKPSTVIGIVLILVGIVGFSLGGFSFSHEHQDAKVGPLDISHKQTQTVPIPPVASAIALVGGIGLVVLGVTRR